VKTKILALALAALGVVACGPDYQRTDIEGVVTSPLGGRIDYSRVEVPLGMILKAHIVPTNDEGKPMETTIRSRDPGVVEVAPVVSDHDYAFLGLRPGITQVEIRAEGDLVLIIDAVVTAQPDLP
jgi:hypothetical protein